MAETVIVRQNQNFETEFLALAPEQGIDGQPNPVSHVHGLTPYGMMLAGLGACTAIVLHTYARNHNLPLHNVEIRLEYARHFQEDCENCEDIDEYREEITEAIHLGGELTYQQREKLYKIAHYCPIYKMYTDGIPVKSRLAESGGNTAW
ncbi:MAG: OsmC family protein [Candidatus Promineifilaceae bacterium]|nr:OsmC family protein [Candidatus Promineifilaceae bacterium]